MVPSKIVSLLLAVLVAGASATGRELSANNHEPTSLTYTGLSEPIRLFPGQINNVHNFPVKIPKGPIAVSKYVCEIVEKDPVTGEILQVPLSEAYLHHIFFSSDNDDEIKFSTGAESRAAMEFHYPYRVTTVEGEEQWFANVHIINTRGMSPEEAYRCSECPCTKENRFHMSPSGEEIEVERKSYRKYNVSLLDEVLQNHHGWKRCNAQLVEERNTGCFPDTYYGGVYCCDHGQFCLDDYYMSQDAISHSDKSTQSEFYIRYNITYTPATPEIKHIWRVKCCDATGDLQREGNDEYDIPKCPDDDDVCVHEIETVQYMHSDAEEEEEHYVDVVQIAGHMHRGGISMTSYVDATGEKLCENVAKHGVGERGEIGNAAGYLVSLSACAFDPPRRMKTSEKIRLVAKYDASEAHTGVMSMLKIAVADVPSQEGGAPSSNVVKLGTTLQESNFWKHFEAVTIFVQAGIFILATWYILKKMGLLRLAKRDGLSD